MVAEKRWGDAKEFYTKGIAALKSAPASQVEGPASEDEQRKEREKERNLEEACYVNRALCNLELRMSFTPPPSHLSSPNPQSPKPLKKPETQLTPHPPTSTENYRSTLHDTQHTLHLNPTSQKSLYRASLALLALSALPTTPPTTSETHLTTAIDLVARGIALTSPTLTSTNISSPPSPQNTAFTTLRARLLAAQSLLQTTARKRETQEEAKRREKMVLNAALHARGIRVRFTDRGGGGPDLEDAGICLRPDPGSAMSEVWFPVLVLYPCHGRSDFLKGVGETSSWGEVVGTVLEEQPLDWDVEGEYILGGVQCFVETKEGGVMKVGMKVRLLDVLAGGKVEVVDQVVRVFVVPRGRLEGWVAEMKARKERKKS